MLGEQVQAQDLVPPVHVEENDMVEKYSIPEVPQQLPQPDERIDDSPADDTASYPSGLDTTREPPPATPEEPVGEPTRQTYASINGLIPHSQPLNNHSLPWLLKSPTQRQLRRLRQLKMKVFPLVSVFSVQYFL
ncbi:hypothetical protein B296_00057796 [Ensete ventricosum]|uniref:Uncharacterized protein n=1 Tax=Ensete ventricosum TaxID=4639 RepID=A0A426XPV9_ENSVE|nr:hypothetical protein B296_00057796 [Ensete ventricosum]